MCGCRSIDFAVSLELLQRFLTTGLVFEASANEVFLFWVTGCGEHFYWIIDIFNIEK